MSPETREFSIHVNRDVRSRITVGSGVLAKLPGRWRPAWRAAVVVGDEQVMGLHLARVRALLMGDGVEVIPLTFPHGEANKTRSTKAAMEDALLSMGVPRSACVVGLGGGISLDMAGFLAATYMRGLPWVAVPTSLLAMVDASVGGKTGLNTPAGKNLVGAFHQPGEVLVDPDLLQTLPPIEWDNGLAELVKHGVVGDRALFKRLEAEAGELRVPGQIASDLLATAVGVKVEVVSQDEQEAGLRAVLNFGHTVGHALEAATEYAMSHGRAVACGMLVEAEAACALCGFPDEDRLRLTALLQELDVAPPRPDLPFSALEPHLKMDKKRRDATLRAALPRRLGEMAGAETGYTLDLPRDLLRAIWERTA